MKCQEELAKNIGRILNSQIRQEAYGKTARLCNKRTLKIEYEIRSEDGYLDFGGCGR
jgi:hypothetical protein